MQNLFDKASLVMVPSGYDNGKLYNIKPEDKGSAFEFERGSVATRINSDGLIEYSGLKDENQKVRNNSFDTSTDWTLDSGWSINTETGKLVAVNGGNFTTQSGVFEDGKTYYVEYEITDYVSGSIKILAGANLNLTVHSSNGIKKQVFTTPSSGGNGLLYWRGSGTFNGSISYVKVIEVETDMPRIDYTSSEGTLLLEPTRTNTLSYSENFQPATTWNSGGDAVIDSDSIISPEGIQNASKFRSDTTGSGFSQLEHNGGSNETFTIFAKKGEESQILIYGPTAGNGVMFDLNDGSFVRYWISNNPVGVDSYSSTDYGNGWYRYHVTFSTVSSIRLFVAKDGEITFNQTSGNGVYIFGAQFEGGPYPTSYIPTQGVAKTRTKDVCYGGGYESLFNQTEGTLFIDLEKLAESTPEYHILSLFGDSQNFLWLGFNNNFNRFYVALTANNAGVFSSTGVDLGTSRGRVAIKYKSGDSKAYANGVNVYNNASTFSFTTTLKELRFNYNANPNTSNSPMKAMGIVYFPEALTDEELQRLTSPSADATTFTELANNNGYTIL